MIANGTQPLPFHMCYKGEMAFVAAEDAALIALLQRVLAGSSAFYTQRLQALGVDTSNPPRTADEARRVWTSLPLTRRDELVRDQLAHSPYGTRRIGNAAAPVRVGTTGSGTNLLVLPWSAADLARERAAGARLLRAAGIESGKRVANTLRGALATPGALLLGDVIEEIGGLDIPLGAIESDTAARQAWELVDRVEPAVLILDTATASRFFVAAPVTARPWWYGVVWLQCNNDSVEQPIVPEAVGFHGWQRIWLAIPEATSFVAHSCAARNFHIDDDVLAEIIDDRLVVTVVDRDAPLLRYATDLRARAANGPCPCGATDTAITPL